MSGAHQHRVVRGRGTWRGVVVAAVVLIATGGSPASAGQSIEWARPASVFESARSLSIEAARARLGLFVAGNPEPEPGVEPQPAGVACPLASTDTMTSAAGALSTQRGVNLLLLMDPWVGSTTSAPELRPSAVPAGIVQGVPIIRCTTSRPVDSQTTRTQVFAIGLVDGVTFGDVVRLQRLDPILRLRPAGIGGEIVGSCLDTADTSVCIVVWQSRNLVLGVTLEGPPAAVNTSTAGALFTNLIPDIVDTLAVVLRPPLACTTEAIRVDTGLTLLAEPICHDGWAFGSTVACPAETGCDVLDVFHVESTGWVHNGSIDVRCAENLARLGMTAVTAQEIAPVCDANDPSLRGGSIRPDSRGTRVTALQIALINLGYDMPIDGTYGPLTEAAVVDFQVANGLIVDGITGSQTQTALGI